MQAYPGRGNPVLDALTGRISVRQLRVMLEHLPPRNAAAREAHGPWHDIEKLLHDVSSQLRVLNTNLHNLTRTEGTAAREPELLPTPETPSSTPTSQPMSESELQAGRDHLQAVLNRSSQR